MVGRTGSDFKPKNMSAKRRSPMCASLETVLLVGMWIISPDLAPSLGFEGCAQDK
jgi:hypothetical protein